MRDRAQRFNSFVLSPGMSIIIGLIGVAALWAYNGGWPVALISTAISILLIYNIKARALFKGPPFSAGALFLILQAVSAVSFTGCITAAVATASMVFVFLCFSKPWETKIIFLINLFCGTGALYARSFLLLAMALNMALILVRAFSMKGLTAAMLGLGTPLIIFSGFGAYDVWNLVVLYEAPWIPGFDASVVLSCGLAVVFACAMFLPSYGYPAKARARNMAVLGLTASAVVMPFVDSTNSADYLPLVNVCAAYNISHFAATRRLGWIGAVLACAMACVFYFWY